MSRKLTRSVNHSVYEAQLVNELDDRKLADLFLPAIKEILKAGGGADAILARSESLAAVKLVTSILTSNSDTALRAATEVLNRRLGKPVEKRLTIYGDVADMNEDQLDREIISLAKRAGVNEVVEMLVAPPAEKRKRPSQKERQLTTRVTDPLKPTE